MSVEFVEENKNLSDDDLICLISSGNYEYLQILINRYMPYILKTVKGFGDLGCDTEDLIQEGVLAVFSAVKAYDASKAKFSTFVTLCINRSIMSQVKNATALKRIPENMILPIEDISAVDNDSPESIYINKESYERFKANIGSALSELEYKVLCAFVAGESYSDIAKRYGISAKSVDNSLKRIRNKLKK